MKRLRAACVSSENRTQEEQGQGPVRKAMYNATLADLDPGERLRITCAYGHESILLVTYLIEKRKLAWDTRLMDLVHKARCSGCGKRGSKSRVDVSVVRPH